MQNKYIINRIKFRNYLKIINKIDLYIVYILKK